MPSLNIDFLLKLKDDYYNYKYFVETGTYNGDTIFAMEPFFDKLYTIEYSESYHNRTKNNYEGKKINFLLGDSSIVFTTLLPQIDDKSIFFLDGHWSSADTGKSAKDCPLFEEITCINRLFKNEAIIVIDDYRLFGKSKIDGQNEDWSQINKDQLLKIIESRIDKVYHLDSEYSSDDRLIIHTKAI